MKPQILDSVNPISIVSFLSATGLVRYKNGVHEQGALRLFHLFMKRPAAAMLNARVALNLDLQSVKRRTQ